MTQGTNLTHSYSTLTYTESNTDGVAIRTIVGVLDENGASLEVNTNGQVTVTGTMIPKGSLQ